MNPHDPSTLPPDLPVPVDDGRTLHLLHTAMPSIWLASTAGTSVRLSDPASLGTHAVLFFYPRTGVPGQPPSLGFGGESWDSIAGARGCTPQSCGFRDLHGEFDRLGVRVWGVSTNTSEHQAEFKSRLQVPFEFLSDSGLGLVRAMRLPTFEFPVESGGPTTLVGRMAWYVGVDLGGVMRVRKVWYPVFPPDRNAREVLDWLVRRSRIEVEQVSEQSREFVRAELVKHWATTRIYSRGVGFDADLLDGFVARVQGREAGHLSMAFSGDSPAERECEVVTLSAARDGMGVGSRLLESAEDAARARGCRRVFLTTTNDNVRALEFYQRRGWRICAVYPGMMDRYREEGKPVPLVAANGVAIRDEIELELRL